MDLSKLTFAELKQLHEQVEKQIKTAGKRDVERARDEIQAIAKRAGLSLEDLLRGDARAKGAKVAVQYRDPKNAEQQWTGRGRQPKWVKDWVDAGKSLDELRV